MIATEFSGSQIEKLTEWFAEDYSLSEIKEMFSATFGQHISLRELTKFRDEHNEEIERRRNDEYELAKRSLSPSGLLIYLRRLIRQSEGKRLVDVVALVRLAKDVWELDRRIEMQTNMEEEKVKLLLEEILTETEKNKELLKVAQDTGLLRMQHLMIE